MSVDSLPVTVRLPYTVELVRGVAQTLTAPLYRDGAAVTATAASAILYSPGGTALLAEDPALTGGVATWALDATEATQPLDVGYRVEWTITHATGIAYATQSIDVCRRAIYPNVTDVDLYRRHPLLDPAQPGFIGIYGQTDWQDQIDEAWAEILEMVRQQGHRPALIMSPESLRSRLTYGSLSIIFRMLGSSGSDDYLVLAAEYQNLADRAWSSLKWVYDADDDGVPDNDAARTAAVSSVWLGL